MGSRITEVCLDVNDLQRMADFWSAVLEVPADMGEEPDDRFAEFPLAPGVTLLFIEVPEPKTVKNRVHLDLSPVGCDQAEEVARVEALGAHRVDIGQGEDASWVVLADPEGNEFCVLRTRKDG